MTVNAPQTQVLFDLGHATLIANLIQGTFPNYQQLIPATSATRTEVAVSEFRQETRLASIFARDGSGIVRLTATQGAPGAPGRLLVTARAEEVGNNEGEIDAVVTGEEAKIAFNSRYLMEVLNVLTSDRVAIETSSPSAPGVLKPVGDERYVHVVMPMFVQW
jgi:DNA polymerase-3 subunit beta